MKEHQKPLAKIAVSIEADAAMTQAMEQINTGNLGGKVTKVDLASWLILRSASLLNDTLIDEIRAEHFNQVIYLDNLLKAAKRSGRKVLSPEELERFQAIMRRKDQIKKKRGDREAKPAGEVGLDRATT